MNADLNEGDVVPVVNLDAAAENAYWDGYDRFEDYGQQDPQERIDLSYFKESAQWANIVAPSLRCAAGREDRYGKGTWTGYRPVVVIRWHDVDDEPANGVLADAHHITEVLIDWWERGAYDALSGDEASPNTDEITAV